MYITICEIDHHPGLMHEAGCSGLVHWDDPEGWDGKGGGRGVQDGERMYTHGCFMSVQFSSVQSLGRVRLFVTP